MENPTPKVFVLLPPKNPALETDVEWVCRSLDSAGIPYLTSATADQSIFFTVEVLVVFRIKKRRRSMMNHYIRSARTFGVSLLVIDSVSTSGVSWPLVDEYSPKTGYQRTGTEDDIEQLLTAVERAASQRRLRAASVDVFVYAGIPEQALLQSIVTRLVETFAHPVTLKVRTWDKEGRVMRPAPKDAVVCVFPNEAGVRAVLGAGFTGAWWDRTDLLRIFGCSFAAGLVCLVPEAVAVDGYDTGLDCLTARSSAVREVLIAWCGVNRLQWRGWSRPERGTLADALQQFLIDRVVHVWATEDRTAPEDTHAEDYKTRRDAILLARGLTDPEGPVMYHIDGDSLSRRPSVDSVPLTHAGFSVYSPPVVQRSSEFLVEVWAFKRLCSSQYRMWPGGRAELPWVTRDPLPFRSERR